MAVSTYNACHYDIASALGFCVSLFVSFEHTWRYNICVECKFPSFKEILYGHDIGRIPKFALKIPIFENRQGYTRSGYAYRLATNIHKVNSGVCTSPECITLTLTSSG